MGRACVLATHIYAACGGNRAKVGITKSPHWRRRALRNHYGQSFTIVRLWEHPDPKAIEAMVCEVLHGMWDMCMGKEVFRVDAREVETEIERAIERYGLLGMTVKSPIDRGSLLHARVAFNVSNGNPLLYRGPDDDQRESREFADREARLKLASSTIRKHWYGEKLEAARAGIKSK